MSNRCVDIIEVVPYSGHMPPSAFPLRIRNQNLRALVKELADHDNVSQNEFIERALEFVAVLRGEVLQKDLAASAQQIESMVAAQRRSITERSIEAFGAGEALREPVQAIALHTDDDGRAQRHHDELGVVAAFEAASG